MLMQNFKSACDLKLSEKQRDALIKTLVLMETGKLVHTDARGLLWLCKKGRKFTGHFNMERWNEYVPGCGTVACIGGTAELIGDFKFYATEISEELGDLFSPAFSMAGITVEQAASALRNYLTTGIPDWESIMDAAQGGFVRNGS